MKWKSAERESASSLQRAAGRVRGTLEKLVTATGRVGHLTSLGFDFLVGNPEDGTDIVGEQKRRKTTLGADALKALLQIWKLGIEWERHPLFVFTLADNVPIWGDTNKGRRRIERDWVVMPRPFAEQLLRERRLLAELRRLNSEFDADWRVYEILDQKEEEVEQDGVS